MKLLNNLLVAIAATGAIGSAQAQTPGNIFNLGTLSPTGSLVDVFNFTVDAAHHTVIGTTQSTNIANLQLQLFSSGSTVPFFTGLNVHSDLTPGNYFAQISGDVVTAPGTFTFSVAANPEPEEWMLLLSGLVIAGFIARRKMSLVAA